MERYEITLDLSRSTKEEVDFVNTVLLRNGYEVYFYYDTFEEPNTQKICFGLTDEEVTKIKEQ